MDRELEICEVVVPEDLMAGIGLKKGKTVWLVESCRMPFFTSALAYILFFQNLISDVLSLFF